jgi:hypothetical protein
MTDEQKGARKTAFETQQIIQRLSASNVGETISYKEIINLCSLSSINACRGYLSTARNSLRREGYVFESIRGKGLRRMSDEQIATQCPAWRRKRIRSQARGMIKDTNAIQDFSALSEEAQISVYVAQTQAAVIEKSTSRKIQGRLSDMARAKNTELLIGESLKAMMIE